jgi:uncharacterized protein YndB with AHSA1/START domain
MTNTSRNIKTPHASTRNSKIIKAPIEDLYRAFTDPGALEVWQAPGEMTATVHEFDLRIGGGYKMSLFYPESESEACGKTAPREDRFTAQFLELTPVTRIVEAIRFDSADPAFSKMMFMIVMFERKEDATEVTILFENIPEGISKADNEAGTRSSLEKLARYVEQRVING